MRLPKIFIFLIATSSYFFPKILAGTSPSFLRSLLPPIPHYRDQNYGGGGVPNYFGEGGGGGYRNTFVERQSDSDSMSSDSGSSDDSSSSSDGDSSSGSKDSMMTTLKGLIKKIPQINFYSSIPNAVGVIGQGYSVLEKLSTAMGTPLPYFIGTLPVTLFGIALIFIPDLTTLELPGFYPNGAGDNDPLSAFPPKPNLDGLPDVDLSLRPDNVPPRIIPPKPEGSQQPETLVDNLQPPPPAFEQPQQDEMEEQVEEEDSPTNPESFQAPRRKIDGGIKGGYHGGNVRVHQKVKKRPPYNYYGYQPRGTL